ncbi:hypothetical protein DFH09DRAFT_1277248 [Mycena vulgaris]|nr:hypothetical protein DFH09DRAFT_1277248 [Mycena vulgaris]
MSLSRVALPSELCDAIIDHLQDDRITLLVCALVCRSWVPASRFHAFAALALSQKSAVRAARLDILLASPHGTIAPAVRALDFPDSLALMQIRNLHTGQVLLKTLLALVPRITQLAHVRALALSDLPWPLLAALRNVEDLTLTRLCAGPNLLDAVAALPRLAHLTLAAVAAVPYRGPPQTGAYPPLSHLLLAWLALVTTATTLAVDLFGGSDVHYLADYLDARGTTLETLDLTLVGSPLDESMLPLLLEPCMELRILRLHFDALDSVRRFFAFGGAFFSPRREMHLEIVVPEFPELRSEDVIPHAGA